jgi:hypothetical protein
MWWWPWSWKGFPIFWLVAPNRLQEHTIANADVEKHLEKQIKNDRKKQKNKTKEKKQMMRKYIAL